jgi:hypothetical protein
VRSAEAARRLAFARAAGLSILSIGLMQRADGVMLDLLMHDRGSLLYSGLGEAVEPAHVLCMVPSSSRQELPSPSDGTGQSSKLSPLQPHGRPHFMPAILPRLLRKLKLQTREQAELECTLDADLVATN